MKRLILVLFLIGGGSSNVFADALEILAPATGAAASSLFVVDADTRTTVIIEGTHVATEHSDLQICITDTNCDDVFQSAAQVRMNDGNTVITITGPGKYRIDKDVTTNAIGVYISDKRNP